jgi:hypothetical protein
MHKSTRTTTTFVLLASSLVMLAAIPLLNNNNNAAMAQGYNGDNSYYINIQQMTKNMSVEQVL